MLKLLCSLLTWASLATGAISASTALLPPTDLDPTAFETTAEDGTDDYLKTATAHGPLVAREGATQPAFPAGTRLTPETLRAVRDANVKRVLIRGTDFSFERWPHWLGFTLSCAGLLIAGLTQRWLGRRSAMISVKKSSGDLDPAAAVSQARAALSTLDELLAAARSDAERSRLLVEHLGELQRNQLANFGDARERLVATLGLAGFARVMDAFALAERRINRAWSAAADGYIDEALPRLSEAEQALATVEGMLPQDR